jgi:hypothetical protein
MDGSAQVRRKSEKYLRVKGVVCQVNSGSGVVRCWGVERESKSDRGVSKARHGCGYWSVEESFPRGEEGGCLYDYL